MIIMISKFLTVSVLASIFSCILSIKTDDFSSSLSATRNIPILVRNGTEEIEIKYYNYLELRDVIFEINKHGGKHFNARRLGTPEKGIWTTQIDSDVFSPRKLMKPMVKLVANIHGDDAVGYALLVTLMQYLVKNYGYDERVTRIMNTTVVYIVPTLNPEGFEKSVMGRCDTLPNNTGLTNSDGIDLDQSFPPLNVSRPGKELEAILPFIRDKPFVLSGNFQGGAVVVTYPLDSLDNIKKGKVSKYDKRFFVKVAQDYAHLNPMMSGVTEGYMWKEKKGGMQDYNYLFSNCFEITLYVGNCKYPKPEYLPIYWHANLESMLKLIENARLGIYGLVRNESGKAIWNAVISVKGIDKEVKTTGDGEYWRLLLPGSYEVTASYEGYRSVTFSVEVTKENPYVQQNFFLTRKRTGSFLGLQ